MKDQFEPQDLPKGPYRYEMTALEGEHHGSGHVYLVDADSKRLASIWGKKESKMALADLIIKASENGIQSLELAAFELDKKAKEYNKKYQERWEEGEFQNRVMAKEYCVISQTYEHAAHIVRDLTGSPRGSEPVFVLRGQDNLAPSTIMFWVQEAQNNGVSKDKIRSAIDVCKQMRNWLYRKFPD